MTALGDEAPPRHVIGTALRAYTQHTAYLGSMVIGAACIDLNGAPTSTVTEAEAADAKAKLEAQTVKAKQARPERTSVRTEVVAPPATSTQPKRGDGFEALRAAARARREREASR
jgi:sRNA-binding protein